MFKNKFWKNRKNTVFFYTKIIIHEKTIFFNLQHNAENIYCIFTFFCIYLNYYLAIKI